MPFFNFRRSPSNPPKAAGAAQPESMEVVRKRAKHRLIGASVLVLIGVVGFPLLFDTQPRPVAVDIPIEIPGKNSVKPLILPAKPEAAKAAAAPTPAADKLSTASGLDAKEEVLATKKPATQAPNTASPKKEAEPVAKSEPKPEAKLATKPEPKAEAKAEPKPDAKADDGARAKALLNGQSASAARASSSGSSAAEGRVVVQVGAFADADKAKEVRQKLERAGLKTYAQVADTKAGKRTRVRVGPFATRAEAEKAASKIKGLDLPAAILTL
jgi:DedD protein